MKNVLAGWDEPVQIEKTRNDKQFNWASSVFTLDFQYITEGKTCKRPVILVAESIGNSSRALNDPKRLPPPRKIDGSFNLWPKNAGLSFGMKRGSSQNAEP